MVVSVPGVATAGTTYVVWDSFSTADSNAAELKRIVETAADDGDTVKVRGGPYQFVPAGVPNSVGNDKPLTITKDIYIWADSNRVELNGGANVTFTKTICDTCFNVAYQYPVNCEWGDTTNADGFALIVVNPSMMDTTLKHASLLTIKNFEITQSFRNAGFKHQNTNTACSCTVTGPDPPPDSLNVHPGGGIEIWRAKITIDSCYVHHNSTINYAGRGGGIFAAACSLTIKDCTIESNYGGYYGGGVFVSNGAVGNFTPCCDTGLIPHDDAFTTIENSIIRKNFAEWGGGVQFGLSSCAECGGPTPDHNVYVNDNLMANNCAARMGGTTGGSAFTVSSGVKLMRVRHNTIVRNKEQDNMGAVTLGHAAIVEPDSFYLNIIAENIGGGIVVACDTTKNHENCGTNHCVQEILEQIENNLFYSNKDCNDSTDAHVLLTPGHDIDKDVDPCVDSLLQDWTCDSECDKFGYWRLRWCDDLALVGCSTDPCVETSNKAFDPYFCNGDTFSLACCSPAFLVSPYYPTAPGWDRNAQACPDDACPGDPTISNLSAWSWESSGPGLMAFLFSFDTAEQAQESRIKWWKQNAGPQDTTIVACTYPAPDCILEVKHCEVIDETACDTRTKIYWRANAKNCKTNNWVGWSPIKSFKPLCLGPP